MSDAAREGHKTEWVYDVWGNCVLERDALGNETRRAFDAENQLVGMTDAAGGSWEVSWDSHGRPAAVKNPLGVATRYTHDEHGRLIGIDDPMGRAVRAAWTPRHDLASVRAGERQETTFEHDSLGRVVGSRDAIGRVSRATRDAMGRITYLERADGERLTMVHDAEGNIIEQTDSLGRTVKMAYAGMNRLIEHIDPMRYRVRLVYDTDEDLIAVENQIGERYRFELDLAGRVQHELGFDGKKHSYTYDQANRANRIVGPDYAVTSIERDALGRVVKRTLTAPPGPHAASMLLGRTEEETYAFDARGDLVEARTNGVGVVFERDALGRIVRERASGAYGDATKTVESRYDHSGLRIERETSHGHRTEYGYDSAGELTDLRAGLSASLQTPELRALNIPGLSLPDWEVKISRDPMGFELARRMPGGVVAIWKRDKQGRPETREVLTGAFPGQQAKDVMRVGYQWQGADQISALIDTQRGATRYEYDPRGHLIAAMFPDGTTQHRKSDAVSNLYKTPDMSDRQYGRGGRLERANGNEYRYDGHGNLVEKVLSDGASWKYLWTPAGRLAEVVRPDGKRVTFAYDALGRRVRKDFDGTVTEFVWDGDDLVHERVSKAGEVQPLVTWMFEPGTFAPVAKFEGRKRFSVVADHLGTPSMFMTEAGRLAWKAQLDVYGVPREERAGIEEKDATENPWRHPGQYEDKETGLYYNRFRYFDPEGGRYVSEDPIGMFGGLPLFGYVPNPSGWVDVYGLSCAKGEGPYSEVGGHHIHAKSAFNGHASYDLDKAFCISQEYMAKKGWSHEAMTAMQRELLDKLADSGLPNTLARHSEIAEKALMAGGATKEEARRLVQKSLDNLGEQGVKAPTRIPWN